jgi:release factor glutamine methyltransferase
MSLFRTSKNMREIIKIVSEDLRITKNEAELVVATLLEQSRFEMYLNEKIDSETKALLKMKLQQLKEGVPVEYITKKVRFLDYQFAIYPGVFIPRLETEYFIELIGTLTVRIPKTILEIGTGCAAIAVSLAHVFPKAQIVANDISATAIDNASENIRHYNLRDRITLAQCDLFKGLTGQFDLIVSNPPYIPTSRIASLPKSVKDFEPILAIDGGYQGVQFIERLVREGKQYVKPHGMMAIEIDDDEVNILKRFLEMNSIHTYVFKKDLFGRFRYLFIGDFKHEKSKDSH